MFYNSNYDIIKKQLENVCTLLTMILLIRELVHFYLTMTFLKTQPVHVCTTFTIVLLKETLLMSQTSSLCYY